MAVKLDRLALATTLAFYSAQGYAEGYFIQSRSPSANWFVYGGLDWSRASNDGPDFHGKVVEARMILPNDLEFAVRGQEIRADYDSGSITDFGDTTISVIQGFRNVACLDYASVEYGEVITSSPPGLRGGVDRYVRARVLGGPTLLGIDASVTAIDLTDPEPGEGGQQYLMSFGLRTQWRQLHVGLDGNFTAQSGDGPSTTVDLVTMWRRMNGDSIYGVIAKGVDGGDESEFISLGYEFRF